MERRKVIELIRVSTTEQADPERGGIPAQRAANRLTAERYGLEIIQTVEMVDVSGTAVLKDPQMLRILEDIQSQDIHGIVTREISRLMRPDNYATLVIFDEFKKAEAAIYLPEGPLDLDSATGRMFNGLRALMAGHELSVIRERMMGGKEALRRRGWWAAGRHQLPYAVDYDRTTHTFSYTEDIGKVREVFRRALAGDLNYDVLSDYLGVSRGSAKYILQHPIYTGVLVWSEKRDLSSKGVRIGADGKPGRDRKKIKRDPSETYRTQVITPGLISQEDFDRVQNLIAQKQELNIRQRTKTGQFTYNGFLWCSKCGDRLHTFRNQYDRYYYICKRKKDRDPATGECMCPYSGYTNRDKLEPLLDDWISRILTNHTLLQNVYDHYRRELESKLGQIDRKALHDEYRALLDKRDRISENFEDGIITREKRDERLRKVDESIRLVWERAREANPTPNWTPRQVAELFAPCLDWDGLDRASKRRVLNGLAPKFYINDGQPDRLELGGVLIASSSHFEPPTPDGIPVLHIDRLDSHPAVDA